MQASSPAPFTECQRLDPPQARYPSSRITYCFEAFLRAGFWVCRLRVDGAMTATNIFAVPLIRASR
jgi:hypothetical protein